MIRYEKSYEKASSDVHDISVTKEHEMRITPSSENRLTQVLNSMERLAEKWKGRIKISYDETEPARDYTIEAILNRSDYSDEQLRRDISDLLIYTDFIGVRSYPRITNTLHIMVIQCNAEEIFLEN